MGIWPFKKKSADEALPLPPPPEEPGRIEIPSEIPPITFSGKFAREEAESGADVGPMEAVEEEASEVPESVAPRSIAFEEIKPLPQLGALPSLTPVEAPEESVPVETAPAAVEAALPGEIEVLAPVGPIYVSAEEYQRVLEDANVIRAKLLESEEVVKSIAELRKQEERELDTWRKALNDVERKLSAVDNLLERAKTR